VYASSWPQKTSVEGIHDLLTEAYNGFLDAVGDWHAIVKLHPSAGEQNAQAHVGIAQQRGARVMVTPQYLDLVLGAADAVVAVGPSNILIEAAILGIPVVSVYGFADEELVLTCEPGGIGEAVDQALSDGWRREFKGKGWQFVKRHAYKPDGKAGERVLALIERIAKC
jgi:hypothetical protein